MHASWPWSLQRSSTRGNKCTKKITGQGALFTLAITENEQWPAQGGEEVGGGAFHGYGSAGELWTYLHSKGYDLYDLRLMEFEAKVGLGQPAHAVLTDRNKW